MRFLDAFRTPNGHAVPDWRLPKARPSPGDATRTAVGRGVARGIGATSVAILCIVALATRAWGAPAIDAAQVKAAMIGKILKFVEWPAPTPSGRRVIAIAGTGAFVTALRARIEGDAAETRLWTVRLVATDEPLGDCDVLVLGELDNSHALRLLERTASSPVLVVADDERLISKGAMLTLYSEASRIRFAVNVTRAHRARIRVSSQLLTLARIVRD
jgi:hypothetical protein